MTTPKEKRPKIKQSIKIMIAINIVVFIIFVLGILYKLFLEN